MPQEMNDGGPVEGMSLRDHQDFAAHILAEGRRRAVRRNHWLDSLAYAACISELNSKGQ